MLPSQKASQSRGFAIIIGIAGILLFSSKAVMVKMAYQFDTDAVTLLLLRMVFALPFYLVISAIQKPVVLPSLKRSDYLSLAGFGFIGYYLASYFDFQGLTYIKAGLERLILFIYPTLVFIISFIFLKKKITRNQAMGIFMTYIGVAIVFSSELSEGQSANVVLGGILIFLSALTYAGYLVGSGWLIPKFGASRFTAYAMIISCICVIAHYAISTNISIVLNQPQEVYWISLAMAIFATVIPSFLISYSIKIIGAGSFSIMGSLGPISTVGLAYLFLDERLTLIQIIGAIVVISGVIIGERSKIKTVP
ncbi:DMT family transporter [Marinoscillum sp. MHG1-6]|uniref:DMT family transporter n=1 Tax=Marinoscillum sp. MHG1-6 TaxID=2959627 RepID=UPI0021570B65|nr:DMT family transporter [Marinoscillum sp. MHG1-6]